MLAQQEVLLSFGLPILEAAPVSLWIQYLGSVFATNILTPLHGIGPFEEKLGEFSENHLTEIASSSKNLPIQHS